MKTEMRQLVEKEGFFELYEKIVQLKLKAPDGAPLVVPGKYTNKKAIQMLGDWQIKR